MIQTYVTNGSCMINKEFYAWKWISFIEVNLERLLHFSIRIIRDIKYIKKSNNEHSRYVIKTFLKIVEEIE